MSTFVVLLAVTLILWISSLVSYFLGHDTLFFILFWVGMAVVFILLGGLAAQYVLSTLFHKSIPLWGGVIIGVATAEFIVPITIIVWVLHVFGVI